jgi:hypothetical protein
MNEFVKPWETCPGCHQEYKNELATDIATKFVLFVRRQYPDDTRRQVEALYLKMYALYSMFERLQPIRKRETGVTANVVLSLIDRMKNDAPLPRRYSQMEAYTYNVHGEIALDEGTEESARRAVLHFETSLQVYEAIGDDESIATAKINIAIAKSKYEDGSNNEELLRASQELYKMGVAKFGEGNEYTIDVGRKLAIELHSANRGDDARELLMKLLATSNQVLGPHHNTTKDVESALDHANALNQCCAYK